MRETAPARSTCVTSLSEEALLWAALLGQESTAALSENIESFDR